MKAIETQNLSFSYNSKTGTLKDINISINEGEFVAILGHNGSGKSTLAKILVGLLPEYTGKVFVMGEEYNEKNMDDLRKNIGIVHNREQEDGVLRIEFYAPESIDEASRILSTKGYVIHHKK